MSGTVRAAELSTRAARVDGVLAVNRLDLFLKGKKGWRRLSEKEDIILKHYQLPELVGVRVETGSGSPELPDGIGSMEGRPAATTRGVPVPVIPA